MYIPFPSDSRVAGDLILVFELPENHGQTAIGVVRRDLKVKFFRQDLACTLRESIGGIRDFCDLLHRTHEHMADARRHGQ